MQEQVNQWLKERDAKLCHRQLLVVSGNEEWACEQAEYVITQAKFTNPIWFGQREKNTNCFAAGKYREYLGQEFSGLVYNCYSGVRANALLALSGTVQAKGLMILICPELANWPSFNDPEYNQRTSYGFTDQFTHSFFIQQFVKQIEREKSVAILSKNKFSAALALLEPSSCSQQLTTQSTDQILAINAIVKTSLGHTRRPLVITADRGRGKSSALGIGAARLMKEYGKNILLTAPSFKTVEQVFEHAKHVLTESLLSGQTLEFQKLSLAFIPPDVLLNAPISADVLMIDEAAAIPTPLLSKLLKRFPRVVFSSTLHGYEGSGRGFELRFKAHLDADYPGWKLLHLNQAIRWYQNDVLEQFMFNSMLMEKPNVKKTPKLQSKLLEVTIISAKTLLQDRTSLETIFQLLVNAHYQTSPDDLVRLLDAPEQKIFVLKQEKNILGVALTSEEGGKYLSAIADDIASCNRRVKGHLVAQSLASHTGESSWCNIQQWRIVRIAIQPAMQRNGLGKKLLNEIEKYAVQHKMPLISSSFGATAPLLRFWQQQGFTPVKLGLKRDASSGENSVIVVKSISNIVQSKTEELKRRFHQELIFHIPRHFTKLDSLVLMALLKNPTLA